MKVFILDGKRYETNRDFVRSEDLLRAARGDDFSGWYLTDGHGHPLSGDSHIVEEDNPFTSTREDS